MASYPVTVYRWDDPGAPQIGNGRASDIINIWQKCLVDGYGDKDPLGWTRPFYDATTQRACYRNNVAAGGSGGYAILFSNTLNDAEYNLMRLSHAKSMTDINTAVGQGLTKAFRVVNTTGNLRRTKWSLIGTAIGFYFSVSFDNFPLDGQSNSALPSMFVGDFFSRIPNDAGRFIAECQPSWTTDTASLSTTSLDSLGGYFQQIGGSTKSLRIFATDNSNSFTPYSLFFHGYTITGGARNTASANPQLLMPIGIGINQLTQNPSEAELNNTLAPYYRGVLPGIFSALNSYPSNSPYPTIVNIGGKNYWLNRSQNGAPLIVVGMEVWDDPFI
ncbi:MAG: hypothetical protein PHE38_11045 [Alishewanella agri]|nr:hypothetical protein [Alishewanella agri]